MKFVAVPCMKEHHSRLLQLHLSVCVSVCFQTVQPLHRKVCGTSAVSPGWRFWYCTEFRPAWCTVMEGVGSRTYRSHGNNLSSLVRCGGIHWKIGRLRFVGQTAYRKIPVQHFSSANVELQCFDGHFWVSYANWYLSKSSQSWLNSITLSFGCRPGDVFRPTCIP